MLLRIADLLYVALEGLEARLAKLRYGGIWWHVCITSRAGQSFAVL